MGSGPNSLRLIFDAYNKGSPEDRKRMRLIGVMGLTGSGKSTFIKKLTNDHNIVIGDDQYSHIPGFDDSTRSDTDALKNIVTWLGAMRQIDIKLSGIIYLHRITDDRIGGMSRRNLRMLQDLVGADRMVNVLLVSTRWEEARMEERQKQIEQGFVDHSGNFRQGFWQKYMKNGAQVMRHDGTVDSARRILDKFVIYSTPRYIQIQNEVLHGKDLSETAAGQSIMSDLEKNAERLEEELANLRAEMEDTLKNTNEDNKHSTRQKFEEEISLILEERKTVLSERTKLCETDNPSLIAHIAEAGILALLFFGPQLAILALG